jgi:pyruvate,water dikinase
MTAADPLVLRIDAPEALGSPLLGGKFAALAEFTAAGFDVPPGFGVTTVAYRHFLDGAGLVERARDVRARARTAELAEVEQLSAELTALIEDAPLPADLDRCIREEYAELSRRAGEQDVPVAVRSSGESEDLAGASFAGQYDTFLWIRGADEVVRHVRRCWAGMFGSAVLTYRPEAGTGELPTDLGMCVGIQQMVQARAAGVMFTLDPVTGDRSKVVVEGCWGLGEGVVGGGVTPSRFVVDKVTFEIVRREVSPQETAYGFDATIGAVGVVPVAPDRVEEAPLTDEQLDTLTRLAKRIEGHRGAPQDVEWAVTENGDVHVLQVRPETVWSRRAAEPLTARPTSALDHVLARFAGVSVAGGPRT